MFYSRLNVGSGGNNYSAEAACHIHNTVCARAATAPKTETSPHCVILMFPFGPAVQVTNSIPDCAGNSIMKEILLA